MRTRILKRLAVFAAAVMLAGQGLAFAAAPKLSQQQFAERFQAALIAALPKDDKVRMRSVETFDIVLPDGATMTVGVGATYQDYLGSSEDADSIIASLVASIAQVAKRAPIEPAELRAVLGPVGYATRIRPEQTDRELPLSRPFAGDLYAIIGRLQAGSIGIPARQDLAPLNLSDDAVWALALENTRKEMQDPKIRVLEGGLIAVQAGPATTSLMLDDAFWDRPEFKGKGDLVVLLLSTTILVAHEGVDTGVSEMRAYIADPQKSAGPLLTDNLLVRRNGKWVVLAP